MIFGDTSTDNFAEYKWMLGLKLTCGCAEGIIVGINEDKIIVSYDAETFVARHCPEEQGYIE